MENELPLFNDKKFKGTVLKLSELKGSDIGDKEKKILGLLDSKSFKFFMNFFLGEKVFEITPTSIKLNGKLFSVPFAGKKEQAQMAENGIKELFVRKGSIEINMQNNDSFTLLMD